VSAHALAARPVHAGVRTRRLHPIAETADARQGAARWAASVDQSMRRLTVVISSMGRIGLIMISWRSAASDVSW
jgi:hypothetical protein